MIIGAAIGAVGAALFALAATKPDTSYYTFSFYIILIATGGGTHMIIADGRAKIAVQDTVVPVGLTATMFSTVVPPVTGTETLNEPSGFAGVEALVVCELWSVFVAAT